MQFSNIGVGLRPTHYPYLLNRPNTNLDWFEVISENFMYTEGHPKDVLSFMRKDYEIAFHGVSLSIGSTSDLDYDYLKKLKDLINEIKPFLVSDHICWTGNLEGNSHNLLPLPMNAETLKLMVERVCKVQDYLGREILLENPSTYFAFPQTTYTEWDFINELTKKSGCKILLDINNVYVSATNNKFDPYEYLNSINNKVVKQIHLAGFSDLETHLFDTHSKPVYSKVWELFSHFVNLTDTIPTMIEWDDDIPEFKILENEALKAKNIWENKYANKKNILGDIPEITL